MEVTHSSTAPTNGLAAANGLAALPTELLLKIFADVPNHDLKGVAVTCKSLAAPAQERLFSTLTIAPRKRQLRVLMHVSKHPVLSTYVEHLSYDLSLHSRGHPLAINLHEYQLSLGQEKLSRFTEEEVLAGYIHTKNMVKEQFRILKGNRIAEVLVKTLPKFVKFKAITVSRTYTGLYHRQGPGPLTPNSDSYGDLYNPDARSNAEIALRTIFGALKKTGVPLKILTINPKHDNYFDQREVLAFSSKRSKATARGAFQSLSDIEMRFSPLESESFPYQRPQRPPIVSHLTPTPTAELLQAAKGLRKLSFGYNKHSRQWPNGPYEWAHYPLFLQFGDGFRWHCLESMELVNLRLYDEEIIDFVNLHAETLREVVLDNITILSALGWNKVADCLKGLSLSSVRVISPTAILEESALPELTSGYDLERLILGGRPNMSMSGVVVSTEPSK